MTLKHAVTINPTIADLKAAAGDGFLYLATVYSRHTYGPVQAFVEASMARGWLLRNGVRAFSPIVHSHPVATYANIDPFDHDIWLPDDKPFMDAARGLIVVKMPGWHESVGIAAETDAFADAGKSIFYMPWPLSAPDCVRFDP